ncbi:MULTISPECIES: hypothetical protein [unclassified Bradyrhizobium]|uniref:hypothetical protein n=1 Tax=unclassified Bradyrhizobium TaxID=2631580 RepID=UPI003395C8FB
MASDDQQKAPSELSLYIFAASVATDETLPASLRNAVGENKEKGINELLAAIRQALGETDEA